MGQAVAGSLAVSQIDTVLTILRDTLYVSRTDTLFVTSIVRESGSGNGYSWLHTGILLVVTIVGWGIVHNLSIKAQRNHFRDVIRNDARIAVGDAIAGYQRWLETYSAIVEYLWHGTLVVDRMMTRLAQHSQDAAAFEWVNRIVEYELLFPNLLDEANRLRQQHVVIRDSVQRALEETTLRGDGQREGRPEIIAATAAAVGATDDLYTQVFQLRRHLQRQVLGPIFDVEAVAQVLQDAGSEEADRNEESTP